MLSEIPVKLIDLMPDAFAEWHADTTVVLADTRHHLGNADMSRIDLVKTVWLDDVLI